MARNKKAQILAAVMCASSIFGSYTVVSAADSSISSGSASVTTNSDTITLSNSKLKVNVDKSGLNIYSGTSETSPIATITKAGVITGTGLTVNGISESTISSIRSGLSATSKVSYRDGVIDTVTNGTYTTESKVTYSGVTDTVKDDENSTIASSSVSTNGITNTTYGKSITDTVYDTDGKTVLSKLTLSTTNAKLEAGTGGNNNAYVNLNSDKKGIVDIKAGTVDGVQGNVTLSGKNVKLASTGLTVNGTSTSTINSINSGNSAQYAKSEVSYSTNTGIKDTVANGTYTTTSTVNATGVTDTVKNSEGKTVANSSVSTSGVTDTVYDTDGRTVLSKLTLDKTSAKLEAGSAYVKVEKNTGNLLFNGKNASLTSTGLAVNGTNTINAINSDVEKTLKDIWTDNRTKRTVQTQATEDQKAKSQVLGNSISNTLSNKVTTNTTIRTVERDSEGNLLHHKNAEKTSQTATNNTTSKMEIGSITNTVSSTVEKGITNITYNENNEVIGKDYDKTSYINKADSKLTSTSITDTVYANDGRTALASSTLSKSTATDGDVTTESGKVSLTAKKIVTDNEAPNTTISSLTLDGDSAKLSADTSRAYVQVYNTTGNVDIKAGTVNGVLGNVTLSGKNVNLDGDDLTLYKDVDGTKTLYAALNPNGTSTISSTNSKNATQYAKSEVNYSTGVKDTVTNGTNITTSTVSATGVTNTVKNGTDTVADSKVSATYGITNTTYGKNITDKAYDAEGENYSALTLTGNSASLKVNNKYGFGVDSSNNVSITGNNATLSGNKLTLTDVTTGKTATLDTNGLSLKDANGTQIGGVSAAGAVSGTSLNITAKNDAGNKTISKVDATSVTDTVYGTDGTTQVASSSVGINGISNKTNISGIAIKDDVNNTKTMTTSIAQDKNGVNISSTKYNVYNDGTSKVQTTDGISTISVNGAKTTISASGNYEYKKDDETGKLILDDKGNPIRSSNTSASLSVDGDTGTISLSGKNASLSTSLSNSTFTLKDITSGKSVASLGTSGLSLNKVNSDGTTANYGTWNSSGLTVTATNTTGNKTTSTVGATSVTDTVYGTDGTTQVASSSVGTSGISNKTSLKTTTGKTDTAISQSTSGVGISSTKYDTSNNITDKTSISVNGGTSSITSYGSYVYDENGNATSYNQAYMSLNANTGTATIRGGSKSAYSTLTLNEAGVGLSGKNVNLSGSTLTLKDATSGNTVASLGDKGLTLKDSEGKTATLTTSGLTLKDENGTQIGGINTAGAITGTSLNITAKNDAGNKTTSTVGATGVTDAVYGTDGTRVAYSNVGTGGISNSTNISGIAIKDDKYNTKTMSTSIVQNANGVNIYSTKYNVYDDGTNKLQTTDGTSSISVNGAKTTISGYGNYEYEKDENGKLVVSSRNSASLSVDGESGIISLSGKNVGLSANGLTLYKDVEGVKTQYASLTAGGLNVNGTGTTTIKSTNATTGAMGQSQLSYNGVTDTVTNAAGNKTTSTVNATGTIDQVYDTDGKTRIAYSNITTTGITDSFTKDGITNSVTTNANGTTFASTGNGSTTIKGGAITTNSITVAGNTIDGGFFDTIGQTNGNTAGIVRTEINGDWITSIEGALDISRSGNISLNADKLTYSYNDGKNSGTLGALANKVDDIYDRTQGIDYDKATGTTTIDGNLSVKDETTTGGTGSTGETGTTPTNGNITANTANIGGVQIGKNAVTATTGNFDNVVIGGTEGTSISKDGVTVGDKKSDNYTSITNNDVVVNNNGSKTSLTDVGNRVTGLESSVSSMNNRLNDVEDRIDKVGAMAAAIANLRTMGYDPEAPTEIAVGIGQYKSDTGLALGIFHYPNQDFMLSASISTSGDEVMGGIGATWKLGRKSGAEKAKDAEAKHLKKAEEMKKLAQESKVKAQAERHAKLLAEREAQKTA